MLYIDMSAARMKTNTEDCFGPRAGNNTNKLCIYIYIYTHTHTREKCVYIHVRNEEVLLGVNEQRNILH